MNRHRCTAMPQWIVAENINIFAILIFSASTDTGSHASFAEVGLFETGSAGWRGTLMQTIKARILSCINHKIMGG